MVTGLNVQAFQWIHAGAGTRPVIDKLAVVFGEGGPFFLAVMFAVLWFFVGKTKKKTLLEATEAAIIGLAINQLIGLLYFHPRPYMIGLCHPLFPHGPENSFPSDHATLMFSAAFYLLMVGHWASCGIPLMTIAVLTAWGRVYSGIHFPFDIAGSMLVGLGGVAMARFITNLLKVFNDGLIRITDPLTHRLGRIISRKNRKV